MSTPIRVAQVVGNMNGGGVEQVVMNYHRHIDRSRVQFDYLVCEGSVMVPIGEIESLGGRVFTVPPYSDALGYRRALVRLFGSERWRIVHSHMNALSVFPLSAAKAAGVPVRIAHSHSTSGRGEYARNAVKAVLRRFSNVYPTYRMACSRYAGEWLFGKGADFEVVPNAIELGHFSFDPAARARLRAELGVGPSTLVVGHVGRFMEQKNHRFLVDVFTALHRERPDSLLVLVGEGPLRPEIERRIEDLGLADFVHFLGQRGDVNELYSAFDVFCLPSLYEGLPVVAVEAQAGGLPIVASTEITNEIAVSPSVVMLGLGKGAACWATELIRSFDTFKARKPASAIGEWDIENSARILCRRYDRLQNSSFNESC